MALKTWLDICQQVYKENKNQTNKTTITNIYHCLRFIFKKLTKEFQYIYKCLTYNIHTYMITHIHSVNFIYDIQNDLTHVHKNP